MHTSSSTEINKRKLINAICNGDVKTAKQLIEIVMDINFILDRHGSPLSPLHAAFLGGSMDLDMLELLLSQPNIDLNISNERLEPPLLIILKFYQCNWEHKICEELALRLIRAGCDINLRDVNEKTPLHLAVKYGTTTITHELLKQGVGINAQDFYNCTPLQYAVTARNLELVCMLLYYNADVYVKSKRDGHTPFSYALHFKYHEIAEVLSNYYNFLDDDVNYIIDNDNVCVVFSRCTNAEQFKAVWPRFDPKLILCKSKFDHCFLYCYLRWCNYSTSDWVECLYLIINSDIALDLIDCKCCNFLCELLKSMQDRHVESEDRIGLIYMVLSLGAEVTISEFNYAVATYGLNQNLEPFIYSTYTPTTYDYRFVCPLHAFVIDMETDFSVTRITQLFRDALIECIIHNFPQCVLTETFAKTIEFFSFPADAKDNLMSLKDLQNHVLMDEEQLQEIPEFRLQEIPEFPSLMELSRNQIHKYLVQKFRFKQPYQLQDFVKKLLIPSRIKNIILFKQPIY